MDRRLDSLDALRGFDMFFITGGSVTGGSALLAALGTLITGDAHSWIAVQMTHASWTEPLRIYDFIFPLFLFIAGVTFPFSTEKRLAHGDGKRAITLNILRRTLTLVVIGLLFEQVQKLDWPHFRVWSVIGRIGIAWGVAALLTLHCRFRTCVAITAALLLGWWLFLRLVPSPDAVGPDALADRMNCFATWFDTHYLTTAHRHEGGLATIAMGVLRHLVRHVAQDAARGSVPRQEGPADDRRRRGDDARRLGVGAHAVRHAGSQGHMVELLRPARGRHLARPAGGVPLGDRRERLQGVELLFPRHRNERRHHLL